MANIDPFSVVITLAVAVASNQGDSQSMSLSAPPTESEVPTLRDLAQAMAREFTKHTFEEAAESEKMRAQVDPSVPAAQRPFFRKRLWHEPPREEELWHPYSHSEHYDEVQREFLKTHKGPADLEWKSAWLNLFIESELLVEYTDWCFEQTHLDENSEKEREFYSGLWDNIVEDMDEVDEDIEANNEKHGRTKKEMEKLRRFPKFVREMRAKRKARAEGRPDPRGSRRG